MRRTASPERLCRRCPFRAPSGRCLDRAIKSGRCGDWIWFVRHGKQIRRLYVRPRDPRAPAQLRSRAQLSAASRKYSYSLTEKQQDACIAAGAKRRSRPRLRQSGPLTGQQYSIRRQYALQKAHGYGTKTAVAPQVPQPQKLNPTTWEPRRGSSRVAPDPRRPGTGRARWMRRGNSLRSSFPAVPGAARAPRLRGSRRGSSRSPSRQVRNAPGFPRGPVSSGLPECSSRSSRAPAVPAPPATGG